MNPLDSIVGTIASGVVLAVILTIHHQAHRRRLSAGVP